MMLRWFHDSWKLCQINFFFAKGSIHPCLRLSIGLPNYAALHSCSRISLKSSIFQTFSGMLFKSQAVPYFVFFRAVLKLVSAIFYQVFVFPPNDSLSKTMKSVFYFIKKALFVLKIFKLLQFFPFVSALYR